MEVICTEELHAGRDLVQIAFRTWKNHRFAESADILERFCHYLSTIGMGDAFDLWNYLNGQETDEGMEWITAVFEKHIQDDEPLIDAVFSRRQVEPLPETIIAAFQHKPTEMVGLRAMI